MAGRLHTRPSTMLHEHKSLVPAVPIPIRIATTLTTRKLEVLV